MPKWLLFLIPFTVLIFFWDLCSFDFLNLDDPGYVTENKFIAGGLTWEGIKWAFSTTHMGHWHPLTWISHMIDISFFGFQPFGHHLVSLCFHAANTLLVFFLIRKFSYGIILSLIGTLFFALHPMRLESVAWIAERKDVLSFFFGFLAILIYDDKKLNRMISLSCYMLSLLAKPTFVTLPFLLCFLDMHRHPDWSLRKQVRGKWPYFFASLIFASIVIFAQNNEGALKSFSLMSRLDIASVSFGAYWGKFFFPFQTSVFYPLQPYLPGIASGTFLGILCATLFCYQMRKTNPRLWLGWLWFLIAALPVSGLVQVGGQAFADRWTLLPHIGLIISALALCPQYGFNRRLYLTLSVSAVAIVSISTFLQMPAWRNSELIFLHSLEETPNNFFAHTNLGSYLDRNGKLDQAAIHYEEAIRLDPNYAEALNNLGSLRARKNQMSESIPLFEKALSRDSNLSAARYNLGLAYLSTGRNFEAVNEWLKLLARDPNYPNTRSSLRQAATRYFETCNLGDKQKELRNTWNDELKQLSNLKSLEDQQLLAQVERISRCDIQN